MASSKLQMMVLSRNQGSVGFSDAENDTVGRLFWACFLMEWYVTTRTFQAL